MNKKLFQIACAIIIGVNVSYAQSAQPRSDMVKSDGGLMKGLDMGSMETSFVLNINTMDESKREKLNQIAANYRSRNRSVLSDLGKAMFAGGVASVVNVIGTEIINLTQVRSKQHKAWMEMRQKECTFVDSLQSVKGQSDFYGKLSYYGPLDPSDMNFDGITLRANREGKEVLRMVCHIDTTRLDHLFLHSKFYLVVDSIVFHPYRSFLPNLKANRITKPKKDASQEEIDYWNTISQFSFTDQSDPSLNLRMDITSSWINELVQVYQDVKLGSFSVNIPIAEKDLRDSVYVYSRKEALAMHRPTIDMEGDCFVIPRSYMPVSANSPSWGTGEYKMKVVFSENCRYNPSEGRSKNWHRDYKQLVRMQNNGKAKNEYILDIVTTFRDNKKTILKATYTPVLSQMPTMIGLGALSGAGAGMSGMSPSATGKPSGGEPVGNGNTPVMNQVGAGQPNGGGPADNGSIQK